MSKAKKLRKPTSPFDSAWQREATDIINALLNGKMTNGTVHYGSLNTLWDNTGGVGSAVTIYKITTIPADNQDYFLAKTWDGTTLGTTEIAIAKRVQQRPSIVAVTILGTAIAYVYADDNHRTASDGVNPDQSEELYEPFEVDAGSTSGIVIAAKTANATGVLDADGNPVTWLDLTPRVWGKYA